MASGTLKSADSAFMEEKRSTALAHAEKEAEKERFGLFSQRPPLGLGDCKYDIPHHPRDADGKVVSEPRNFYCNPMKSGKGSDVYFDPANFLNKEKK